MQTQICTYNQAVTFCAQLNKRKIGGGVKVISGPEKHDPTIPWKSNGVFLFPWDSQPDIPPPTDKLPYYVHFNNNVADCIGAMMSLFFNMPADAAWRRITEQVQAAFDRNEVLTED